MINKHGLRLFGAYKPILAIIAATSPSDALATYNSEVAASVEGTRMVEFDGSEASLLWETGDGTNVLTQFGNVSTTCVILTCMF
jgi:hypothetical protein